MRRLFSSSIIILLSTALAFSQGNSGNQGNPGNQGGNRGNSGNPGQGGGNDDFDDNGPIQIGWGVVTPLPVTSGASSMVVFASFGMKNGPDTTQAGILPPDLTTNTILFVSTSGRLSRNLGVAIVNPGMLSTNVTLTLRKDDGTQLATSTFAVASHQQTSKFITELFSGQSSVPSDLTGTLTVTSASPVSVIGLRFRGANFSTLPVTNLAAPTSMPTISTGIGGAGALLLPQFAAGGGWATEIDVVNTGTNSLTLRVDLFKPDGTALSVTLNRQTASSFTDLTIPPGGVLTLSPRDSNGDSRF